MPSTEPCPPEEAGTVREVRTFCRVCEASCSVIATVQDDRIVKITGDRDHKFSQGHFCKKAMGAAEVTSDLERVTHPLKRVGGPGEFERVSWDEALDDITSRLARLRAEHGPEAFATYLGQPPTNTYSTAIWYGAFNETMETRWNYTFAAEDSAACLKAGEILYGSAGIVPKPDLWRTNFAIVIGANPLVSHGSLCSEPLFRKALNSITGRGGRVVVIDPRRSETAQAFEHVAVNAGSDPWLLLAMLNVIFAEGLEDRAFLAAKTSGAEALEQIAAGFSPEAAAAQCGLDPHEIRQLARDFAMAPTALVYGRTGTCTQRFATLTNMLQNLLCLVTGNVDRVGGIMIPQALMGQKGAFGGGIQQRKSRRGDLPEVAGMLPSRALIDDILTPDPDRLRALMLLGGNPMSASGAAGPRFAEALEGLELLFSLDLYVNESNRHAHYILPVTSMYEHEDMPLKFLFSQLRTTIWAAPAVVAPRDEARDDWRIMHELCARLGLGGAYAMPVLRDRAREGFVTTPQMMVDAMLAGSELGQRLGLTFERLQTDHALGLPLGDGLAEAQLPETSFPIPLAPAELQDEVARLQAYHHPEAYPFRMIGMRELLSQNGWLHNARSLMGPHRRHAVHINPGDATMLGIADGDQVQITSAAARVQIEACLSDRLKPGHIALPHGWGHDGGWTHANAAGGVNSNLLASKDNDDIERLAGMSILNGIPVALSRVEQLLEASNESSS
mgnify:CR=1 FL=1